MKTKRDHDQQGRGRAKVDVLIYWETYQFRGKGLLGRHVSTVMSIETIWPNWSEPSRVVGHNTKNSKEHKPDPKDATTQISRDRCDDKRAL